MPLILILIGLLLVVSGIQNSQAALGKQLVKDFSGPGNFFYWIAALLIIGVVGYAKPFQQPSRVFMVLLLLALLLNNRGFFANLTTALQSAGQSMGSVAGSKAGSITGGAVGGGSSPLGTGGGLPLGGGDGGSSIISPDIIGGSFV